MNSALNNAVPLKDWNTDEFHIRQLLKGVHTGLPCQVREVFPQSPGALKQTPDGLAGVVTVYLAVEQWTNDTPPQKIPGTMIYNVPYFRLQAGNAAIVIDPEPGDWGWIAFGERDISAWKRTRVIDIPPSRRMLQQSDGGYFPGMMNDPPAIWIRLRKDGIVIEGSDQPITVNTTTALIVNADSTTINAPANTINGNLEVNGNIGVNGGLWVRDDSEVQGHVRLLGGAEIGGIEFNGHRHPGVENGGGITGNPI